MRCIVCHNEFHFQPGVSVLILKHVAYGHDFVHAGRCAETACGWIFPEPGYDCAAFARDPERVALLRVTPAEGWFTLLHDFDGVAGLEPLRYWALVEHSDGSRRWAAIVRATDWEEEPGGAEFPAQQHYLFDNQAAVEDAAA